MAEDQTVIRLPEGWGGDPLSDFMQAAFKNSLATFVQKKSVFGLLLKIEEEFQRCNGNLDHSGDPLLPSLLHRSHSAFLASCRLSMSGQATETFPLLRSCLEYALYALHIKMNPTLAEVWLARHESEISLQKVKSSFQLKRIMKTLLDCDAELHSEIHQLYEQTIDFGGHPNQRGVFSSIRVWDEGDETVVRSQSLHGDTPALRHSLNTTALVGLNSLMVFRIVFKERFDQMGISTSIDSLKRTVQQHVSSRS